MKKILLISVIVLLVVAISVVGYFYLKKFNGKKKQAEIQRLSQEQADNIKELGNGTITFVDPKLKTNVEAEFNNGSASVTANGATTKYQLVDALLPYNLDQSPENEYPFIVKASYSTDSNIDYLLISHNDGKKFNAQDIVAIGSADRVEDIHSTNSNEIAIDTNVPDNQGGKQKVILTYTFLDSKIIAGKDNIDIDQTIKIQPAKPAAKSSNSNTGGSGQSGSIAISFDDGPGTYTPEILDILKAHNIKATFFMIGENAAAHPDFVKRVQAEGHLIGDHTYTHTDLKKLSYDGQMEEIKKTRDTIKSIVPDAEVKYFRPPFGSYNSTTDQVLADLGMKRVLWDVDPRDWAGGTSAAAIEANILANTKSGSIILDHDGVANSSQTALALPDVISGLQSKGFNFVLVSNLVK